VSGYYLAEVVYFRSTTSTVPRKVRSRLVRDLTEEA